MRLWVQSSVLQNKKTGGGNKVTQEISALATKPDGLISIPESHRQKERATELSSDFCMCAIHWHISLPNKTSGGNRKEEEEGYGRREK